MMDYATVGQVTLSIVGVLLARSVLVSSMSLRRLNEVHRRNTEDIKACRSSPELAAVIKVNDQRYKDLDNKSHLAQVLNPLLWTYRQFYPEVLYHE